MAGMLWTIAVILVVLSVLGLVLHIAGSRIHILPSKDVQLALRSLAGSSPARRCVGARGRRGGPRQWCGAV